MNNIAVVVTFNKKKMLVECLTALLNQSLSLDGVVVLDNGSSDGTKEYLKKVKDSRIHPVFSETNLGGAGGFNRAIKAAMTLKPTAVWVMDDDSIVKNDALEKLVDAKNLLQNQFGFLSSNVIWTDGQPCLMNIPGVTKVWNEKAADGLVKLDRASFVSMYINAEAIKKVGFPISEFFIWGDDIEFSQRISKQFPSYLVGDSVVVHKMKENAEVNILIDDPVRISRYFYDIRNKFYRFRKQGTKALFKFLGQTTFLCLKVIFKHNSFKLRKLEVILHGVIAGISFNPQVEEFEE